MGADTKNLNKAYPNNRRAVFLDLKPDFIIRNIHDVNPFGNILIGGARVLGYALADQVLGAGR